MALDRIPADPEAAGLIRGAQVQAIVRLTPLVMAACCFNGFVVLATSAALGALEPKHWVWAVALFGVTAKYLHAWRRHRSDKVGRPASRRAIRRVILNGALFGALWGAAPAVTFPGAPLELQLFIACVTAGMMSSGAFVLAPVPLAAMSYVMLIAAGAFYALLQEGGPVYLGVGALLVSYIAVLFGNINWSAALLLNRLLAEAQVRTEVAARELAQQRAGHAERMTALGELAGGIAHDFNNILQAISGGAWRISRDPQNLDEVARQARWIQDAVDRGGTISRRLLAFARRDALSPEAIDVADLLADVGELLTHTLEPDIRIRVDPGEAPGHVLADRGQLETVLLNLATNARDAMPDGGDVTITANSMVRGNESESPPLRAGRYLRLAVADTGTGMDAAVLARVAEPFFTTKPKGRGTGLGLSMAKGFAEQSGGAFEIASKPGCGTVVTLWLPQASASLAPPSDLSRTTAARREIGAGRRVLVVDDDAPVRQVLMSSLEDDGFIALGAEDASGAIAQIEGGARIDALVTDLSMPGMNGIDLIGEVHARSPGLPVVLLTGHLNDVAGRAAEGAPHLTVLQKPLAPGRIAERLAALLAQSAP